MKRFEVVIILSLLFICSCSTAETAFYDINKAQVIDNSNRIYEDSSIKCFATFKFYSNANNPLKYSGIFADFIIEKDSSVVIDEAEPKISPSKNSQFIKPESYTSSSVTLNESASGSDFSAVKQLVNQHGSYGFASFFQDDTKRYDSLYLDIHIKYNVNGKYATINKNHVYIKDSYKVQLTR